MPLGRLKTRLSDRSSRRLQGQQRDHTVPADVDSPVPFCLLPFLFPRARMTQGWWFYLKLGTCFWLVSARSAGCCCQVCSVPFS